MFNPCFICGKKTFPEVTSLDYRMSQSEIFKPSVLPFVPIKCEIDISRWNRQELNRVQLKSGRRDPRLVALFEKCQGLFDTLRDPYFRCERRTFRPIIERPNLAGAIGECRQPFLIVRKYETPIANLGRTT